MSEPGATAACAPAAGAAAASAGGAPAVSVIVPAFDAAAHLAEALDCVRAQTLRDLECIVVDDGSRDATAEIAAARGDVRLLRQANGGASAARNAGIAVARGEFLAFLDADDLWYPERLAVQLAHHRAHPELDFSYVALEERVADGVEVPAWALARHRPAGADQHIFSPSGLMIRREAMLALGGFDPAFRVGENAEWLARARHAGLRHERLDVVLGAYRIHERNVSHDQPRIRAAVLRAMHAAARRKRAEAEA